MDLKRLASDKDFTVSEASRMNAISIAGRRAFETGKVEKPDWPYLKSWEANTETKEEEEMNITSITKVLRKFCNTN